jgi:hypothetical protein
LLTIGAAIATFSAFIAFAALSGWPPLNSGAVEPYGVLTVAATIFSATKAFELLRKKRLGN